MRWARRAIAWAVVALIAGTGMELGLRHFPWLVPTTLLKEFQPGVRQQVAEGQQLRTSAQMRAIPRDDGGAPLMVFKPYATWRPSRTSPPRRPR